MRHDLGQDALPFDANGQHPRPAKARNAEDPSFAVTLLALSGVEGLGRRGLRHLVRAYGDDLGAVWSGGQDRVRRVLGEAGTRSAEKIAAKISGDAGALLEEGRRGAGELAKNRVFTLGPSGIPPRLREVPDGPLWLFVQGDDEVLHHRPVVAVVGTRQASARGRRAAGIVAHLLSAYPITLVSGLAEGIDEEAHLASLEEGAQNVAFLGYGLKHARRHHPEGHQALREAGAARQARAFRVWLPSLLGRRPTAAASDKEAPNPRLVAGAHQGDPRRRRHRHRAR